MAKKTRLGIIYSYNENWIGGTYYIHNLLKALLTLPYELRPNITVLTETTDTFVKLQNETGYPNLLFYPLFSSVKYTIIEKVLNKVSKFLFNNHFFDKNKYLVDIAFPILTPNQEVYGKKKIYWIPDFQDQKLPDFFTREERNTRAHWQHHVSNKKSVVVFSSNDSLTTYSNLYPQNITRNRVVKFASIQALQNLPTKDFLLSIYELPEVYFMCPNQFWAHKNHILVLKALVLLKNQGTELTVVFTGKEYDYRNPDYFSSLKQYVVENELASNVRFLGFIERTHQLALMNYSKAIIQPSLCEGWSTVIEDAKALNKKVIASNLKVHQEQLGEIGNYFDTKKDYELADLLKLFAFAETVSLNYEYEKSIKKFAKDFILAINS